MSTVHLLSFQLDSVLWEIQSPNSSSGIWREKWTIFLSSSTSTYGMNLATYWRWLNSQPKNLRLRSFSSLKKKRVCTRVKKFQLVQNPSVVAFSVHNLVVVAVLAHMTSLQSFGVNGLACASSSRVQQTKSRPRPQHTRREREVSCSAVKIWHTRQLPPLQIGLMRVGFRDYCSSSSKPTCSDKYFLVEILGGNSTWLERVGVFLETEKRDENTIMKRDREGHSTS